ncbi:MULTISPECIES: hypothetical protein [Tissierellales]|jgi:hypothetical protein|uniref:Uncharacterized protein n=1 Tax=Acidilutibacter cellobiosedens TaxID=2507161 RepID=A0A410QA67_9FIRM|nr:MULTISPECIES: hypothetical protein [Tissierellales]MBE6083218.1 hypothetical protein [Tissierellaceae bacterium]QAT60891.1 hypothetical protein EQM13_04500 [Acidilutibacter cellobiosedens]SCL90691.1 hypothetical protein PP176A_2021 [Sporanaerobacter sp. PP17-6a]
MLIKVIFLILLLLGVLEIFFGFFTMIIERYIRKKKLDDKSKGKIKLFFVLIFFIGVIYFLFQFVIVMANLLGINLGKRFTDIFR